MLFKILRIRSMAKQGINDPQGFVQDQAKEAAIDAAIGALIVPAIFLILFLALLFVLSYTHLLGGPYGIAKFFFWLLVMVYGLAALVLRAIYGIIKQAISGFRGMQGTPPGAKMRDTETVQK